jgi:broad specificity phosphatase PhoE
MTLLRHALGVALLAGAIAPAAARAVQDCELGALYVVRHAEKATGADPDVELSDAGKATAQALVGFFADRGLDVVYATHLRRTLQTALPLATARDLEVRVLPAGDTPRLLQRLKTAHCGQHVLVVGHSNTVPEIAAALGSAPFEIPDTEFGTIWFKPAPGAAWQHEKFVP